MIKNIVFDMGNVLLNYNPQVPLDLFCSSEAEKNTIRKELFEGAEWVEGDLGNITNEEKYERIRARIPQPMHEALKRCVYEWHICMEPLPGAKEFCGYLKGKGYALYVLSNASDDFYGYFPRFAPLSYFDGIVVSADVHMIKPDGRIYAYLLNQYGIKPQECLFIDDLERNVEAAKGAGLAAEGFLGDFRCIKEKYIL